MDIIVVDILDLCRLCGVNSCKEFFSFLEAEHSQILNNMMRYLPIQVTLNNELSTKICINCHDMLEHWHQFVIKCEETDQHFKEVLSSKDTGETTNWLSDEEKSREDKIDEIKVIQSNYLTENVAELQEQISKSPSPSPQPQQHESRFSHLKRRRQIPPKTNQTVKSCNFCPSTYINKSLLEEHIKDKHYNIIFKCDVCTGYYNRSILLSHMLSHTVTVTTEPTTNEDKQPDEKSFKCTICSKTYKSSKNFYAHKHTVIKCTECPKLFNSEILLIRHKESKHNGDKRSHVCRTSDCNKSFKTYSNLYTHEITHKQETRFECNECGKGFKFKSHFNVHMTMHTKVLKFFCKFCRKGFAVKNNLTKHLLTHDNSLESKCHLCEFKTTQKRYLAGHVKKMHQTNVR